MALGSIPYGVSIYDCQQDGDIAITYDDGPYLYTSDLLDIIKSYGGTVTFFITGNNLGKGEINDPSTPWPNLIKRMIAEGHQVASHTWTHQNLSSLTSDQVKQQMIFNEIALNDILGYFPTYMRPPYSASNGNVDAILGELGYHIIYFNLDTEGYLNDSPTLIQNSKNIWDAAVQGANPASTSFLQIEHDPDYQSVYNLTSYMFASLFRNGFRYHEQFKLSFSIDDLDIDRPIHVGFDHIDKPVVDADSGTTEYKWSLCHLLNDQNNNKLYVNTHSRAAEHKWTLWDQLQRHNFIDILSGCYVVYVVFYLPYYFCLTCIFYFVYTVCLFYTPGSTRIIYPVFDLYVAHYLVTHNCFIFNLPYTVVYFFYNVYVFSVFSFLHSLVHHLLLHLVVHLFYFFYHFFYYHDFQFVYCCDDLELFVHSYCRLAEHQRALWRYFQRHYLYRPGTIRLLFPLWLVWQ
ncbi:polysaccharide deacetylase [Purpureocillium lavendulum]|uniref:Polysaccharide deacetylase n=1 Tax=Purpureocillium lavendulum TaxID=1247861 RepID=A0AB34G6V6_9HYPO|nr:polysaccharide deacetylase [Purpureocillium lavendulum]